MYWGKRSGKNSRVNSFVPISNIFKRAIRKVILSKMVSVDGFIEGPDHDINWHVWSEEMNYFMRDPTERKIDEKFQN